MRSAPARPTSGRNQTPDLASRIAAAATGLVATLTLGLGLATGPIAKIQAADEPQAADVPRAKVAALPHDSMSTQRATSLRTTGVTTEVDSVARAKRVMADCKAKYDSVHDYSCTFYKRERFDGVLSGTHVMQFKARTSPVSFYVKCVTPRAGREAIWIKGKNSGKVIAHDAGFVKVLAGTMYLDPKGSIAMEDNRHPITEAGLGNMIDTVRRRWEIELKQGQTRVEFHPRMMVGDRECTMVETTHPEHDSSFIFHRVRIFIDDKLGLPIRLEGYDWPKHPGAEPELMEEYTYGHLRLNAGLTERDFDPANPAYAYGRF